jgi:hypothetical protein
MNEQMRLLALQLAVQAHANTKDVAQPDVVQVANNFYDFLKGAEAPEDLGSIVTSFVKKQMAAEQSVAS